MFLSNLFHLSMDVTPAKRQRVCTSVAEKVDLPGYGIVEVGCRVACEGEGCPRPQLLTLKALNDNPRGVVIEVISDNLSVVETIPSMMDIYEGQHLATVQGKNNWRIYVRREV
jgi:tRNA 2-thiouridine synthesizing protein A